MRKLLVLMALCALVVMLGSASFAQTVYVLTNDDNPAGNTATAFVLNTATGALTQAAVLTTGGTGLGGGFFAATSEAVAQNEACVFVADTGSDDIAAFSKATGFKKVGNYSNAALSFSALGAGGSISVTPNGKFLYGGYSGSENIGAWSVASNCALNFIAAYVPSTGADTFSPLKVTPSGSALIVPSIDLSLATLFSINATTGALTEVNNVNWSTNTTCESVGCYPSGLDITENNSLVVFGNPTLTNNGIYALTASIGASGLSNPQAFTLTNSANVGNDNVPWFTSQSYPTGNGGMLFGMSGYNNPFIQSGIVAAEVSSTKGITVVNSTAITTPDDFLGSIRTHELILVVAIYPNTINTYKIAANGSLTLLKSTTDAQGAGLLSLDLYPETR